MNLKVRMFDSASYERDFKVAKFSLFEKRFNLDAYEMMAKYGTLVYPNIAHPTKTYDEWVKEVEADLDEEAGNLVDKKSYTKELLCVGTGIDKNYNIVLIILHPDGTLEQMVYDQYDKNMKVIVE